MRHALPFFSLLLLSPWSAATDIFVSPPGSIQTAIDAAADGDRVLAQPGTYFEAINFGGKAIQVIGVGGSAATTIDAGGAGTVV